MGDGIGIAAFLIAGAVGAAGNRLLYWGNFIRSPARRPEEWRDGRFRPFMAIETLGYVATAAGFGWGVSTLVAEEFLCLLLGAVWPEAITAARKDIPRFISRWMGKLAPGGGNDTNAGGGAC